jgi:hypothetical protein
VITHFDPPTGGVPIWGAPQVGLVPIPHGDSVLYHEDTEGTLERPTVTGPRTPPRHAYVRRYGWRDPADQSGYTITLLVTEAAQSTVEAEANRTLRACLWMTGRLR